MNPYIHSLIVVAGCLVLAFGLLSTITVNKPKE